MSLRLAHVGDLGTSWRIETGDFDLKILSSRWCTSGTYQVVERIHGSIHTKLYPDFCGTNIMTQDCFHHQLSGETLFVLIFWMD